MSQLTLQAACCAGVPAEPASKHAPAIGINPWRSRESHRKQHPHPMHTSYAPKRTCVLTVYAQSKNFVHGCADWPIVLFPKLCLRAAWCCCSLQYDTQLHACCTCRYEAQSAHASLVTSHCILQSLLSVASPMLTVQL